MEILRLPNTVTLEASFSVPESNHEYIISYQDLKTSEVFSTSASSNSSSIVSFPIDDTYLTYNGTLIAQVMTTASSVVIRDSIDVIRPYCDIELVASKLSITTAQTSQCEKIARKVIESEAGTFNYVRKTKEIFGMGMDYIMLDEPINNLYYIYENGVLIYDYENPDLQEFKIGIDGMSITTSTVEVNKMEYTRVWRDRYLDVDFSSGFEYLIDGDFGYRSVPEDVQEACELLIQDISSNSTRYSNRYISEFDNREFKIKFTDGYQSGTGNLIADKLLSKYKNRIIPGVL